MILVVVGIVLLVLFVGLAYAFFVGRERMPRYCPKCKRERYASSFCFECGSALTEEPPLTCPKCSHILRPEDDYCEKCGTKVK